MTMQHVWATQWGLFYNLAGSTAYNIVKHAQTSEEARHLLAAEALLQEMARVQA